MELTVAAVYPFVPSVLPRLIARNAILVFILTLAAKVALKFVVTAANTY